MTRNYEIGFTSPRATLPSASVTMRTIVARARGLIESDHLAVRLAASAAFVGALALVVWWASEAFLGL